MDPGSGVQTVDLVVSMHRGRHADEIRKSALPPANVVALLIEELPRQILKLDPEETRFSVEEQRDWLVARAREFGLVGAWRHSLGLRGRTVDRSRQCPAAAGHDNRVQPADAQAASRAGEPRTGSDGRRNSPPSIARGSTRISPAWPTWNS